MDLSNIKYTPILLGIQNDRINWAILVNDQEFSYFQGLGYLAAKVDKNDSRSLWNGVDLTKLTKEAKIKACRAVLPYSKRLTVNDFEWTNVLYVKNPKIEDLLDCLFLDAQSHESSFESWCDELGYDQDSIKAKKTYDLCIEGYFKLKKALGKDYEAIKLHIESLNV